MAFAKTIDRDTLNELPLKSFDGPIYVIENRSELDSVLPKIKSSEYLGFDTETRPSFRKGKVNKVALLQLATDKESFLIRINRLGLPKEIMRILSDPDITKIGAAIRDDIKSLQKIGKFEAKGFTDLQTMAKNAGIECMSLKKLAAIVMNIRISKSQQLTNWDAEQLTEAQQHYAATDAWISLQIFQKLRSEVNNSGK